MMRAALDATRLGPDAEAQHARQVALAAPGAGTILGDTPDAGGGYPAGDAPGRSTVITAGDAFRRFAAFPILGYTDAFADARLAVLAPHPDDESLGCGGLIAAACAAGAPPMVIVLTNGAASHPASKAYPPARLAALRAEETLHAASCLGLPPERVIFLNYPDTAAPRDQPAAEAAGARIADIMAKAGCDTLLAPWRHDPHCDHEAAAMIALAVCRAAPLRLLSYPVWGLTLAPEHRLADALPSGFRLDVAAELARKRAAILAHRSQYGGLITDDPAGFQMTDDFIARFLDGLEIFIETDAVAVQRADAAGVPQPAGPPRAKEEQRQ